MPSPTISDVLLRVAADYSTIPTDKSFVLVIAGHVTPSNKFEVSGVLHFDSDLNALEQEGYISHAHSTAESLYAQVKECESSSFQVDI